ncbi:MAG: basic amino acid/polyamine antiporter, APA family, partial [Elusimicrobia bacterium]
SALGERHLGAWRLGETDPATGVPRRAVFATTAAGAALVLFLPSMSLVDMANFSVVTQYLASSVAVPVLRRRRPELARPYRLPAADEVAVVAILVCLWLMTQVTRTEVLSAAAVLAVAYVVRRAVDGSVSPRSA